MGLSWKEASQNLPERFPPDTTVAVLEYPDEATWRWVYGGSELEELGCDSLREYNIGVQEYVAEVRKRGAQVLFVPLFLDEYQQWLEREKKENSEDTRTEYAAALGESVALRKVATEDGILPPVALGADRPRRDRSGNLDFWLAHLWQPAFVARPEFNVHGTFSRQNSERADVAVLNLTLYVTKIDRAEPSRAALQYVWDRCSTRFGIERTGDTKFQVKGEIEPVPGFFFLTEAASNEKIGVLHMRWPRFLLFARGIKPTQWPHYLFFQRDRPLLPFDLLPSDPLPDFVPALRKALEFDEWIHSDHID